LARVGDLLALEDLEQRRLGARQHACERHHDRARQNARRQQRLDLAEKCVEVMGDHDFRLAVLDLEGELFVRVERVEIDDSAAGFEDSVVEDDERRRIRQKQADLGAAHDADLL
jgi:hypothetical protein